MLRKQFPKRADWEKKCKEVGFDFHSIPSSDGTPYWQEGVAYEMTAAEIDNIDNATYDLYHLCIEHAGAVVKSGDYPTEYGFDEREISLIEQSWVRQDLDLYGRFDLAFDGQAIKMLEFNGDTPTGLLESSIVQWQWLEDVIDITNGDQFNSLHEKLIESWETIRSFYPAHTRFYFMTSSEGGREDWGNLEYIADTGVQAGFNISLISAEQIAWDPGQKKYVDEVDKPIDVMFKLYPWEWMTHEELGSYLLQAKTRWIEPPWKMLLSNKALLPLLWQRFPDHPLLLPAYFDTGKPSTVGDWVKKPLLAREGANIKRIRAGEEISLTGSTFHETYDKSGYVYQQWIDLPNFDGFRPLIGSWIVGGRTAGIGIREDRNDVTGNDSHFVPHYFIRKDT